VDLPTEIDGAADYLQAFVLEAEVTTGADRAAYRRAVKELEPLLLRLARNPYQGQLVQGAVSAIAKYLKQEGFDNQSLKYMDLCRLRNAPAFGPKPPGPQ
jgi:hypothetical protein